MVAIQRPGFKEGNYTSWTFKWSNAFPNGIGTYYHYAAYIDDKNNALYLSWKDSSGDHRFGLYNTADFSVIFQSPAGADYKYRGLTGAATFTRDVCLDSGGALSLQTYVVINRYDGVTMEIWRGGVTPLWSRDITLDESGTYVRMFTISMTGKYLLVYTTSKKLLLYEGS